MLRTAIFSTFVLFLGSAGSFAASDAALLALAPPDSRVVAAIDVSRARNSQFGEMLVDRVADSDSNFKAFLSKTGFDMRRDVHDFVFAGTGNLHSAGAILARGHFSPSRIEATARSHGLVVETYRGAALILNSNHTAKSAMGFPAPGIAVIADISTVEDIIRRKSAPAALNPELQKLIEKVAGNNDAWFASLSAGVLAAPQVKQQTAAAAIRTIKQASGGLRFADPIPVAVDALTGSSAEAEALSVVIRGIAALARISHPSDPYLATLGAAQNLNVTTNGSAVHLAFSLAEKDAEDLVRSLPKPGAKARR
ncbi:MAG TPA: hypothetical protein VF283_09255 [Bryobacteraceae bacterium]